MGKRFLLAVGFISLTIACGYDDSKTYVIPNPEPVDDALKEKFAAVEPVLKASCLTAGCHAGGAIADITTAGKLKASNSKARVENGTMPPQGSDEAANFNAESKEIFLSFFK